MADVIDRVVARHVLLLQEIGGVALALGENRDQHVGAGHFLAAGRLHVDRRALDDALEAGGRLGLLAALDDEVFEFGVDVLRQTFLRRMSRSTLQARKHRRGVGIVDQREQQMFERRVFVAALVGDRERPVQGLF